MPTTLNEQLWTNGAAHVLLNEYLYGPPPHLLRLDWAGVIGTGDNTVIYTSGDVGAYKVHYFWALTAAGSISVQGLLPDGTWSGDLALEDLASTTPATRVLTTTGITGLYRVSGTFSQIRVLQNGATATNARGYHAGA